MPMSLDSKSAGESFVNYATELRSCASSPRSIRIGCLRFTTGAIISIPEIGVAGPWPMPSISHSSNNAEFEGKSRINHDCPTEPTR
jgi:hypothetical protein